MTPVSRLERAYFGAVAALAAWVGGWGYLAPDQVERALPWPVPPLHARFLGGMYFAGVAFTLGCMLARRWASVRVVVPMIAVWTGMLFVVSLLHADEFPSDRSQTYVWFAAYLAYPLIAVWLAWRHRGDGEPTGAAAAPAWTRAASAALAAVSTALGAALLVAPGAMADAWPWPVTDLLAQIYSAPFLSLGVGCALLAREGMHVAAGIPTAAMLVFAAAVLAASAIHRDLFDAGAASTWLWFGGFAAAAATLAAVGIARLSAAGAAGRSPRPAARRAAARSRARPG